MPKGTPWPVSQENELNGLVEQIIKESGGNCISTESPTLVSCSKKYERTTTAVSHKVRQIALKRGIIKTRKQKLEAIRNQSVELAASRQASELDFSVKVDAAEQQQAPAESRLVSIPLSKIYGKVDFQTFMSLINE